MSESAVILIVDDQRATRALIRSSLIELGYREIVEAGDGEQALEILAERSVQLIISDAEMPKLDGLGLLRVVRANPDLKSMPFVLLTARADAPFVTQAKALGVNGYLVKPFALGPLKQRIEAAIGPTRR